MRLIVIGGDAAGMSAAGKAKRTIPEMDVVVLEQTGDVSYSACGMPYNIADPKRSMEDLVVRKAEVFREKQGIDLRLGHRVDVIEPGSRTVSGVTTAGQLFSLQYDSLLIATGASSILPKIPGVDLPGVMSLKSLDDGRTIKEYILRNGVRKAVIIGMGYIGFEMAEALRSRSIEVEMVKPSPLFIPWMARGLAAVVQAELESAEVRLFPGTEIREIGADGKGFAVVSADGVHAADMVLCAIGVKPNSRAAAAAGLELGPGGSVAVDRNMRTSAPGIFAAGDCADAYHVVTGKKTWIPLALRANRAGWAAADNICGIPTTLRGIAGTAVFKVFSLEVALTGLSVDEARKAGFDPAEVVLESRSRAHGHPGASTIHAQLVGDRKTGRLLGAQLVGREGAAHRINAAAVALHAGMTVREFGESDLAYAPPFGPVWDPLLTAANQLQKEIG
jgi:NADPH-dependent 2,4-dienoyl-CoA reductase/sulfur reductase-like enzyme